jgi:undecaprenyl-diphosphatase
LVLGLVQGLTEFLPISSSGHLVVAEAAFDLKTPGVLVEVVLHGATLLAVVLVYWSRLVGLCVGVIKRERAAWRYVGLLCIGSIPAGLVGFLLADPIEGAFESLMLVGINFVLTALILWSTRWTAQRGAATEPSAPAAFGIGVAQSLAILPGISRSGSTIAAAKWLGMDAVNAAEFSFLLAIPAIVGAGLLQAISLAREPVSVAYIPLTVGFVAALISGVLAIKFLVMLLRRGTFHRFAPYCLVLGVVTIAWGVLR